MREKGATNREIAAALGVSKTYASSLHTDPTGEKDKARKATYDMVCVDCGGRVSGTEGPREQPRCLRCSGVFYGKQNTKWTEERVIEAIRWWNSEYGEPPSAHDWNATACRKQLHDEDRAVRFERLFAEGKVPWFNTVVLRFGSWNQGLEAAGFTGRIATGGGGNMRRMRRHGKAKNHWWYQDNNSKSKGAVMEALVLRKNGTGWVEVGTTEARSYQDAVNNVADREGEYIAVPALQRFTVESEQRFVATVKA